MNLKWFLYMYESDFTHIYDIVLGNNIGHMMSYTKTAIESMPMSGNYAYIKNGFFICTSQILHIYMTLFWASTLVI